jgi:hypothetical protein
VTRFFAWSAKAAGGLATGKIAGFFTAPYAGTITGWSMTVDNGNLTWRVWKIANGTAKPTSADSINTSGLSIPGGLSPVGQHVRSTDKTDFTTLAVAAGDIFAAEVTAVSGGVVEASGAIEILQS